MHSDMFEAENTLTCIGFAFWFDATNDAHSLQYQFDDGRWIFHRLHNGDIWRFERVEGSQRSIECRNGFL